MMETKLAVFYAILLSVGITECVRGSEDLTAEETAADIAVLRSDSSRENKKQEPDRSHAKNNKYSSRIVNDEYRYSTELPFGTRTVSLNGKKLWKNGPIDDPPQKRNRSRSTTETVLDFRIRKGTDFRENEIGSEENVGSEKDKADMATAGTSDGKHKKEVKKEDDEEEKTLSQQVADGKYGLIQNEIFANGSKRPGILSYLPNTEVPKDTKENLGGLEKDEIWLAEDHVLVLRGGKYPEKDENRSPSSSVWPPIDDYEAPTRQVKIPKNPKIPPPFPVRLKENGPLEFVGGDNSTFGVPPFFPPFPPPFPFRPNETFPLPFPIPGSPDENPNGTLPFPLPPGPLPPFLANFPPGAAFLPPPGNLTDFDEDDPSVYYPPKYDFYYSRDNATAVPPGPLVPGIILPPPPDFFSPLEEENDENDETSNEAESATRPPFVGPNYLPVPRKPPSRERISPERPRTTSDVRYPEISNGIPDSSPSPAPEKPTVTYVYPENFGRKQTTPSPQESFKTTKIASSGNVPDRFSSPIYVPNGGDGFVYHPLPTTSPKPNHITIPTTKSLSKEIYIVTTPEADVRNRIEDSFKKYKGVKTDGYVIQRPEIHPLRSLVKPNVSVSYVGKYGHLPASTPFPFPKTKKPVVDDPAGLIRGGHYITHSPNFLEHVVTTPATETNEITVTPVPVVKKIKIQSMSHDVSDPVTPSSVPPQATFYFYEERPVTSPVPQYETTTQSPREIVRVTDNEASPPIKYRYPSASQVKSPIRQYLEETFHSSNVLPNKPGIPHANVFKHGYRISDVPKIKHLDYGTPVTVKPVVKFHYVANGGHVNPSRHKIKTLEVENSGSSGLQTVRPTEARPDPVEFAVAQLFTSTRRPEIQNPSVSTVPSTTTTTTSTPTSFIYTNQDGPFVPSDYYATAGPDHVRFTPQDHSLVDDITKNYFTVFGQKINVQSTTPLTPYRRPTQVPVLPKEKPAPQLRPPQRNPAEPSFPLYDKHKFLQIATPAPRPQSHFEQYLKEITGEDQKDYIVNPTKLKKGKGFPSGDVSRPYRPPAPIYLQPVRHNYFETPTQVPPIKTRQRPPSKYYYRGFVDPSSYVYRPSLSTTLRPVVDVEIRPQYVQHVSSTVGPFESVRRPPEKVSYDHDFGQYLREITGFTSPSTTNPVKIQTDSNYFSTTPSPANQIDYSPSRYPAPEGAPKPVSLEGDILINYKPQRPEINPDAETVVPHTVPTYPTGSNFKIVDPPDLSQRRPRPPPSYDRKPHDFDAAKNFFENIPKSGYFSPSHPSASNSFISYNLPGNGGHFYFLTPQIVEKSDDDDEEEAESEEEGYRTINRQRKGSEFRYPSQIQQNPRRGYSNQDYLRRRRKKP